jgi:hypothetical protein
MKHAYSHASCEKEQRLIKPISGCLRKVEWRWKKTGFWMVTRMSGCTEKEGLQTLDCLTRNTSRGWTCAGYVIIMDFAACLISFVIWCITDDYNAR